MVCHKEVSEIDESELYLRYVLREILWDELDRHPERHINCSPNLAQFIIAAGFVTPVVDGAFSKRALDPDFVRGEEARVTRGYQRLREISGSGRPIWDYPMADLAEFSEETTLRS
jgi:hypothetical protein